MTMKQTAPAIAHFTDWYDARDHGAKFGKGFSQWRVVEHNRSFAVLLYSQGGKIAYLTKHGAPINV